MINIQTKKGSTAANGFLLSGVLVACGGIAACSSSSGDSGPQGFTVGGELSGLAGDSVELTLNGEETLSLDADGAFEFDTLLADGDSYEVTISEQPGDSACLVDNESGEISDEAIDDVLVQCGDFSLAALNEEGQIALQWSPAGTVDILYSSDRACDWSNVQQCADGGASYGVSGGSAVIDAENDGLRLDTTYHLVMQANGMQSDVTTATALTYHLTGYVLDTVLTDQHLIAGGYFQYYGGLHQGIAHFRDDLSGTPLTGPFLDVRNEDGVVAQITAVAKDPDGGFYIGGNFASINGEPRAHLARLNADGTLDEQWTASLDGGITRVNEMLIDDNRLYVAGRFEEVNGNTGFTGLVALDFDGNIDGGFSPEAPAGTLFFAQVNAIAIHDERLYVAGRFDTPDASNSNVAALDLSTGSYVEDFDVDVNDTALAILPSSESVYIGGSFSSVNGESRNYLVAVSHDDGAVDPGFTPNLNGTVTDIAVGPERLYITGHYDEVSGSSWEGVAALSLDTGGLDINRDLRVDGIAVTVEVRDDALYVAGLFRSIGGERAINVGRLPLGSDMAVDPDWAPHVDGIPLGFVESDYGMAVYGGIWGAGGEYIGSVAALSRQDGKLDANWNAGVDGLATAVLHLEGGQLYAGGLIEAAQGESRSNAAAFDATDGTLLEWNPEANSAVQAITTANGNIAIGGDFTEINGEPLTRLALVDPVTGALSSMTDPQVNDTVLDLAYYSGDDVVFVGGWFDEIGGGARAHLAATFASDLNRTGWDGDVDRSVNAVLNDGNSYVMAGGRFTESGGQNQAYITVLTPGSNVVGTPPDLDGTVTDLHLLDSTDQLLVSGYFSEANGSARDGLAVFNFDNGDFTLKPVSVDFEGDVLAVTQDENAVVAAGAIIGVNGNRHGYLVMLHPGTLQPIWPGEPGPTSGSGLNVLSGSAAKSVEADTSDSDNPVDDRFSTEKLMNLAF